VGADLRSGFFVGGLEMDDSPVGADRLEVIDSGSGERLYTAMRDQAERGREFQRRVRWMWLRRELSAAPGRASVIDLRDAVPAQGSSASLSSVPGSATPRSSVALTSFPLSSVSLSSMVAPRAPRQEDSA
jgi:hypothetical protein